MKQVLSSKAKKVTKNNKFLKNKSLDFLLIYPPE
jgi:hypothetical protein